MQGSKSWINCPAVIRVLDGHRTMNPSRHKHTAIELHSIHSYTISNTKKHTQHNTEIHSQYITMYATHMSSKVYCFTSDETSLSSSCSSSFYGFHSPFIHSFFSPFRHDGWHDQSLQFSNITNLTTITKTEKNRSRTGIDSMFKLKQRQGNETISRMGWDQAGIHGHGSLQGRMSALLRYGCLCGCSKYA